MLRKVETKYGQIEGLPAADPRITSFKGIPYAKPPVGNLRFHAPVKNEPWEGILKAYKYSPIPVQPKPYWDPDFIMCKEWAVDREIPMSEDCLYLNVWTPAKSKDEKLPVYVWIYGGGFQTGYTAEMEFDGERIARRGIVVVTLNYRVNIFGFMCHPDLTKENPEAPANFGLLDQRMAMEWVKENIEAFGGDSNNITLGGQSAGGASVAFQVMHGTKNQFNRAVIHSGMFLMEENDITDPKPLAKAEKEGQDFLEFAKVKSIEEFRALTTDQIVELWEKYGGHDKSIQTWLPVKDDKFLYCSFFNNFKNNEIEDIPFILGYTNDEFLLTDPKTGETISPIKNALDLFTKMKTERKYKSPNFVYNFNPEIPGPDNPGTFHSSDLWFWFETLAKCWRPFNGTHYDLARKMCNYLCNFIKTGNPNGEDHDGTQLPEWYSYNNYEETLMTLEN